jgi:8-oxo-dGTP pyrophosphatase MutT (NUDIX family)
LSVEALRARIVAALDRDRRALDLPDRVRAAVLVLFLFRGGVPALVFGKKTEDVPHHKGQFSFPGGVVRSSDPSVVETALREAEEEVGLDPGAVEVLGLFHDIPTTVTNFVITPVLALARGEPTFRPDGREIERVIEIPLAHLLDPTAFREEEWERGGARRSVLFVSYGEDVVWGTTGRILREVLDAVFPEIAR